MLCIWLEISISLQLYLTFYFFILFFFKFTFKKNKIISPLKNSSSILYASYIPYHMLCLNQQLLPFLCDVNIISVRSGWGNLIACSQFYNLTQSFSLGNQYLVYDVLVLPLVCWWPKCRPCCAYGLLLIAVYENCISSWTVIILWPFYIDQGPLGIKKSRRKILTLTPFSPGGPGGPGGPCRTNM